MSELNELIARVEALSGADREVDAAICVTTQYGGMNSEGATNVRVDFEWDEDDLIFEIGEEACCNPIPKLTSSTDAALAFAERVLPGWFVAKIDAWHNSNEEVVGYGVTMQKFNVEPYVTLRAGWIGCTRPLAIISATLKAKAAE